MLEHLRTEHDNERSRHLDRLSTQELLKVMSRADQEVASAVNKELSRIRGAVDKIAERLKAGGRLFYIGAGTSGRLGVLDAAECPPTFGVAPDLVRGIIAGGPEALVRAVEAVEDDPAAGAADLLSEGFSGSDALVGLSASGRTPYVLGAVAKADEMGALTCGISCTPNSELSQAVQYPIEPIPGPEILTGSTRLRAGTATKLVLNMISTAVLVRLGHVYGNLMVNVQPTNSKLEDRARRIIQQTTGVTAERAAELLESGGRSVRTAIVMEKKKIGRAEAERLLAGAGGRIHEALGEDLPDLE